MIYKKQGIFYIFLRKRLSIHNNHTWKWCRICTISEFQTSFYEAYLWFSIDKIVKSACISPCRKKHNNNPPPRQTRLLNSFSNSSTVWRIDKSILIISILFQSIFLLCKVFFAFVIVVCRAGIKIKLKFFVQNIKKSLRGWPQICITGK
jgi:hypothetical protein